MTRGQSPVVIFDVDDNWGLSLCHQLCLLRFTTMTAVTAMITTKSASVRYKSVLFPAPASSGTVVGAGAGEDVSVASGVGIITT